MAWSNLSISGAGPATSVNATDRIPASQSGVSAYITPLGIKTYLGISTAGYSGAYSDLTGKPTLGTLAALSSVNNSNWSGTQLSVANGGTGLAALPGSSGQILYNSAGAFAAGTALAYAASGANLTVTAQHTTDTALSVQPYSTLQTAAVAQIGGLKFMPHPTNWGTAVNEVQIYFPTGHVSGAPYVIGTNTTTFGGAQPTDNDATMWIGFNWAGTGTQVVADGTSTPNARYQYMMFEHDWWQTPGDSTSRVDEWHYDVSDDTSTHYRLFHQSWSPYSKNCFFAFTGAVEVFKVGEIGGTNKYCSSLTQSYLTIPYSGGSGGYGVYFTKSDNSTTYAAVVDGLATIGGVSTYLIQTGASLDVRGFPHILDGQLNNNSTRPAASTAPIAGEIWGHSYGSYTADDGFLRLSAGGGTTTTSKSFIDISGFSYQSDMANTITLCPGGVIGFQVGLSGAFKFAYSATKYITGAVNSSAGMYLYPSNDSTSAFNFTNNALATILNVDSLYKRVGIQNTTPGYPLDVTGAINTTTQYNVGGTKVVGSQITGYGTPTGGSKQGSFAAGSITLANLAAGVAQLIIDLKGHGLLAT